MTVEGYRQPSIRSIVGGCLLALLVLAPLLFVSNVVKWVGVPFLFLPQTLGLLPKVERSEVRTVAMATSPNQIDLPEAGPYFVFTDNFELLDLSIRLEESSATPWFRVVDPATGVRVPLDHVARGLMPYDPAFVPGRPVFRFVLGQPGTYQTEHMLRDATVSLVPDRTTGHEMEMLLAAVVQAALVALLIGSVLGRRARARAARIDALLAPGRVSPKELQRHYRRGEEPPSGQDRGGG